jgi:hypothetical protein
MKSKAEIRQELVDAFDVKGLRVDGKLISESPHFEDYLRIGRYLSRGTRGAVKDVPVVRNALVALDADMTARINKSILKEWRTVKHFQAQKTAYESKTPPPAKDRDVSKLLTAALADFERLHGFVCVGDRLPNYAGFVYGNVFKESLNLKQHWKDVGAGEKHGEYTHRLQWYILIQAGAIKTVPANQEATVFASIGPWQKGKTNLWTFLFDLLVTDASIGADPLDFRSPENLNMWLVGEADPDFCPVLRAFLRARMAKRANTYRLQEYLQKKLAISADAAGDLLEEMNEDREAKKNPSARIVFPRGAAPALSRYAE